YEMSTDRRADSHRQPLAARGLEKVINRCLEQDPGRRWQSAAELANALEAVGRPKQVRIWIVSGAAVLFALLIAGYVFFRLAFSRSAPKLTNQDTVVLADFVNNTGDPIFEGTLRQALAIQLEQSPFLKIMDDEQVQRVLRLMRVPPGTRITNPVA